MGFLISNLALETEPASASKKKTISQHQVQKNDRNIGDNGEWDKRCQFFSTAKA